MYNKGINMPTEFLGTPEQIELVRALGERAYLRYPKEYGLPLSPIPTGPYCYGVSNLLNQSLLESGFDTTLRMYKAAEHFHVDLGNDWMADAVWQQFIPPLIRDNYGYQYPKILIIQRAELPQVLTRAGINQNMIDHWTNTTKF